MNINQLGGKLTMTVDNKKAKQSNTNPEPIKEVEEVQKESVIETLHYVGPTSIKYGLSHAAHFNGELPENIKTLITLTPQIKALFVNSNDFPAALTRASTKGTHEYEIINKLRGAI